MVVIRENYESYSPPREVRPSIERLLTSLPAGKVASIEAVVLTNAATLSSGKTKRIKGRKYRANECLGFYRRASSVLSVELSFTGHTMTTCWPPSS